MMSATKLLLHSELILSLSLLLLHPASSQRCETIPTSGGTRVPEPCVFPFIYRGALFRECTDIDGDQKWCSVEVDKNRIHVGGKRRWGNCNANCFRSAGETTTPRTTTPRTTTPRTTTPRCQTVTLCHTEKHPFTKYKVSIRNGSAENSASGELGLREPGSHCTAVKLSTGAPSFSNWAILT